MCKSSFIDNRVSFNPTPLVKENIPALCSIIGTENVLEKIHEKQQFELQRKKSGSTKSKRNLRNQIVPKLVEKKFEYVDDSFEIDDEEEKDDFNLPVAEASRSTAADHAKKARMTAKVKLGF